MKRIAKSIVLITIILALCCSFFNLFVSAAPTSSIAFSKSQLNVGDEFTVTVRINADEIIYSSEFKINYDSSVLQFVNGDDCDGGAGVITVAFAVSSKSKSVTKKYTFKTIGVGETRITTADAFYVGEKLQKIGVPAQGGTVSVKAKPTTSSTTSTSSTASTTSNNSSQALSSDATLKSLAISDGTLSPKFSASKTSYSVVVANSVTEIKLYATAKAEGAKVQIKGDTKLKIGKNQITVSVTAPDGTIKNYTVNVTRSETEEIPSEPVSSEEPTTNENPLTPVIDGVKYSIATDLSGIALLNGFRATTTDFGGQQVAVAVDVDDTFKIYYLKAEDSTDLKPYTYNENTEVFEKLVYLIQKETVYIVCNLPDGYTVPENYYSTNGIIANLEIKCFANTDAVMNDFYYIYCFANGRYGFYRYDSREGVLQRYPELRLVADNKELNTDTDVLPDESFLGRFNSLTTNAKVIVIGLVVIIALGIALAALMIYKHIRKSNFADLDNANKFNDFNKVSVISNFSVVDDFDEEDDDDIDDDEESEDITDEE